MNIVSDKVIEKTRECGKKLKVNECVSRLFKTLSHLVDENPKMQNAGRTLGKEDFEEVLSIIVTYYSLELLARTHSPNEFEMILTECSEVEEMT